MGWMKRKRRRCGWPLVAVLAALFAWCSAANAAVVDAPVTNGPCLVPSGSYCALFRPYVSGTFVVESFALSDDTIVAEGSVQDGTFFEFFPSLFGATFPDGAPLTLPVTEIVSSCSSGAVTLTMQGSEAPDPAHGSHEPLPAVLFFDVNYQPPDSAVSTMPISVGLLPTSATFTTVRGLACSLAKLASKPVEPAEVAHLNAVLRMP